MVMESTAIRGLPEGTIRKYRALAALLVIKTGEPISMNSLYVRALEEFLQETTKQGDII